MLRLPSPARLTVAGVLLAIVGLYGLAFRGKTVRQFWEIPSPWPRSGPAAQTVASVVSLGDTVSVAALVVVTTLALYLYNRRGMWAPTVTALTVAVLVSVVGKPMFAHYVGSGLSYPSGHASVGVSVLAVFALLAYRSAVRGAKLLSVLSTLLGAVIVFGVWLGNFHRMSEVIAGAFTAVAVAILTSGMVAQKHDTEVEPLPRLELGTSCLQDKRSTG